MKRIKAVSNRINCVILAPAFNTRERILRMFLYFFFQRKQFGVLLKPKGKFFTGYDPEVNVQCTNVFSTSALRMGHSLIRAVFDLRSADGTFSRFRGSDRSLPRD